jgi:2-desacetyl-2-hydroxyethyl bacteriochlorophyllide A dehydrogenase
MRALVWEGDLNVTLKYVPLPEVAPGQALVKVYYAGICSTDTEIMSGHMKVSHPPHIPGHEIFGRIAVLGSPTTLFEPGQRVVIDTVVPCNACPYCLLGQSEFCIHYQEIGINLNGGWADYVLVPFTSLHAIPDSISDEEAALIEPMVCPFGAVDVANLRIGDTVLVLGTGPAGLIFIQLARQRGASLVACVGRKPERVSLARDFGADLVIGEEETESLLEHPTIKTFGGFDVIIDAVGSAETVQSGIKLARPGGKIIWYGLRSATLDDFPLQETILKNLTIIGKTNSPKLWDRAISLVATGRLVLKPLLQDVQLLENIPGVLGRPASGSEPIKRIIKVN